MDIKVTGPMILGACLAIGSSIFTFSTMYQQIQNAKAIIDIHLVNLDHRIEKIERKQAETNAAITVYNHEVDKKINSCGRDSHEALTKVNKLWSYYYSSIDTKKIRV